MQYITKEEWADWRQHPATMKFFSQMKQEREDALEILAAGAFSQDVGRQNIFIGLINALTKILNHSFEETNDTGNRKD